MPCIHQYLSVCSNTVQVAHANLQGWSGDVHKWPRNFSVKLTPPLSHLVITHKSRTTLPKLRRKLQPLPFKKAAIIACINKCDFSFLIPASASERDTLAAECCAVASASICSSAAGCSTGITAAVRDPSVYSTYQQLPVYLAWCHNTIPSPTPYITHRWI